MDKNKDKDIDADMSRSLYPVLGRVTERQIEEELDRGKVCRLNGRFFKFLFGLEDDGAEPNRDRRAASFLGLSELPVSPKVCLEAATGDSMELLKCGQQGPAVGSEGRTSCLWRISSVDGTIPCGRNF